MTNNSKPPSPIELVWKWIYGRWGWLAVIAVLLLGAVGYAYVNWDRVSKWPGVPGMLELFSRIPQADPNRFSIMVAHLQHDTDREYERLIIEDLKEFEGIQVLELDRTILLEGPIPEEQEQRGHGEARGYLRKSRASVVIWGTVLRAGEDAVLKLYWTPACGGGRRSERYDAPALEMQLRLPEVFWSDLAEVLRLLVASRHAEYVAQVHPDVAGQLPSFIARVRTLLETSKDEEGKDRPGWDTEARGRTRVILGNALYVLGNQTGKADPLEEAVAALREALGELTRDEAPSDWAMIQNNVSVALRKLGRREEALEAAQAAAEVCRGLAADRPDAFLPNLAGSLSNLGAMLGGVGRLEEALGSAEEAVEIYRGLASYRPDAFLPDLAGSLSNLGVALSDLGRREEALNATEEAVEIWRGLAAERPDAFLPDLAMSLNNLGNSLSDLGRREEALKAAEEAVEIRRGLAAERPDAFLPDLAASLNNLGAMLGGLGQREEALTAAEEAVEVYRRLAADRPDAFLPALGASLSNMGVMLSDLGQREEALEAGQEAVETYRRLAKDCRGAFSPNLAATLSNLGYMLSELGHHEQALGPAKEAVEIWRGLAADLPDTFLPDLARALSILGDCLRAAGASDEARGAFAEGVRTLRPVFLDLPEAFAPTMSALVTDYTDTSRQLGKEPDMELLAPIVAKLEEMKTEEDDEPSGGERPLPEE